MPLVPRLIKATRVTNTTWSSAFELNQDGNVNCYLFLYRALKNISTSDHSDDIVALGSEVVNEIQKQFGGSHQSLSSFTAKLESLYRKYRSGDFDLIFLMAAVDGERMYLTGVGGGIISLIRGNRLIKLIRPGERAVCATGIVLEGDVFILSAELLYRKYSPSRIVELLSEKREDRTLEFFRGEGIDLAILKIQKISRFLNVKTPTVASDYSLRFKVEELRGRFFSRVTSSHKYERQKKTYVTVGLILIVFMIITSLFGIKRKKDIEERLSYIPIVEEARMKMDQSLKLFDSDKDLSRKYLEEAEALVNSLHDKKGVREIEELTRQVEVEREKILGVHQVHFDLYVDMTLIKSGFTTDVVSISGNKAYVFDREGNSIIKVDLESKRSELVRGIAKDRKIYLIASYVDELYLFSDKGVLEEGGEDRLVIEEPPKEGNYLARAYAGNLYLVDLSEEKIFKYQKTDGGFLPKAEWLADDNKAEISSAIDMEIDGNIWVLLKDSRILVLTSGGQGRFVARGYFVPQNIDNILAREDDDLVYLMDRKAGVIASYNKKDGEYVAQYRSDAIKKAVDFFVNAKQKKAFLFTENEILVASI
jgi:hypothetical protein